ncbi:MAG: sulfotransferase [Anaerolineae bacterium]
MDLDEVHWRQLDPIFIFGRQRTGTSIMWRALRVAGFLGFPEGHLWYDLIKPFAWWRDPEYKSYLRQDIFTVGAERNLLLEKQMAMLLDHFHRDLLSPELVRWVSKSPGADPIAVAPMLAQMFPKAQFIFMQRNPITTVNSTVEYVLRNYGQNDTDFVFRTTCKNWTRVMRLWRWIRPLLASRSIEVAQEHIVSKPDQVACQVMEFLGAPQWAEAVADVFKSTRENTAFPEKSVDDFMYAVNWTDKQKQTLTDVCGAEMALWGYQLDFQHPGEPEPSLVGSVEADPPFADIDAYYRWMQKYGVQQELQDCKELLSRIKQGRVMRVLNWLSGLVKHFDFRRSDR